MNRPRRRRAASPEHQETAAHLHRLLAPVPTMAEHVRARQKDAMLRAARIAFSSIPAGPGSRDGIDPAGVTARVEHPAFPGGILLADIEPIDAERARRVTDRIEQVILEHVYDA